MVLRSVQRCLQYHRPSGSTTRISEGAAPILRTKGNRASLRPHTTHHHCVDASATSVTLIDANGGVSSRGEALFNRLRIVLHKATVAAPLEPPQPSSTTTTTPSTTTNATTSIPIPSLDSMVDKELKETLAAYSMSLVDVLRVFPRWFAVDETNSRVRLTAAAVKLPDPLSFVPLSGGGHPQTSMSMATLSAMMSQSHHQQQVAGGRVKSKFPVARWTRHEAPLSALEWEQSRLEMAVAETFVPYLHNRPAPTDNLPLHHVGEVIGAFAEVGSRAAGTVFNSAASLPEIAELTMYDQLYRMKGFHAPSEVLHAFCCLVPTFAVELGQFVRMMPPALRTAFLNECPVNSDGTLAFIARPFARYPMVFDLDRKPGSKALVKLNAAFPFVTSHPHFGLSDRRMRKFSREFSTARGIVSREKVRLQHVPSPRVDVVDHVNSQRANTAPHDAGAAAAQLLPKHLRMNGLSVDTRIFTVLLEHLPQLTADQPFVSLVKWINTFPPEHLAILNEAPQERVITIVMKYRRVFQLSTVANDDSNLFRESKVVVSSAAASSLVLEHQHKEEAIGAGAEAGEVSSAEGDMDDVDAVAVAGGAAIESNDSVDKRVEAFHSAVASDMIGDMEALLTMDLAAETFDRGDDADGDGDDATLPLGSLHEGGDGDGGHMSTEGEHNSPAGVHLAAHQPTHHPLAHDADFVFTSSVDALTIRRLPPDVAPGALCDLDASSTPDPELLAAVFAEVPPPPSLSTAIPSPNPNPQHWRWAPIERIYRSLTGEQRQQLRRFKGLPNFLRLHGKLFEVSADLRYVIAHVCHQNSGSSGSSSSSQPSVLTYPPVPPLIPTQKLFSDAERTVLPCSWDATAPLSPERRSLIDAVLRAGTEQNDVFRRILGDAQIPRSRQQLKLLDPNNPLLDTNVLLGEIAEFLPAFPVPFKSLFSRLPPVLAAAIPSRRHAFLRHAAAHRELLLFNRRGTIMVTKRTDEAVAAIEADPFTASLTDVDVQKLFKGGEDNSVSAPPVPPYTGKSATSASVVDVWSLSRALSFTESIISPQGTPIKTLQQKLPAVAIRAFSRELGSGKSSVDLEVVLSAFPDRFAIQTVSMANHGPEGGGDDGSCTPETSSSASRFPNSTGSLGGGLERKLVFRVGVKG